MCSTFSIYVLKIIFHISHVKVVNDLQVIRRPILSLYLIKKLKHLLEGQWLFYFVLFFGFVRMTPL